MRKPWLITVAAVAAVLLSPLGLRAAELKLLIWTDYLAPQLVEKFQRETGIHVRETNYTTYAQLYAILKSGKSGFDIAIPAEYQVRQMIRERLIEKVDPFRLPGFENVQETWRSPHFDPANEYSQPWLWGATAYTVDTAQWQGDIDSLSLLFDPPEALRGRIGMLRDPRDTITMALRYLELPQCTDRPDHLERLETLLARQSQWVRHYDSDDVIGLAASGESVLQMIWNGDALRARQKRPSLRFAYPREGVVLWSEQVVVPKGGNISSAQAFMRFMLKPENAAIQSNHSGYGNAIRGSEKFLSADLRDAPEVVMPVNIRMEFMRDCPRPVLDQYEALWNRIISRRP